MESWGRFVKYSRKLFLSNFVLFTCICTHNVWKDKGVRSLRPRPSLGNQRIQAFKLVDHLDLLKEVYSLLFVVLSYFAGPLDESMYSTVDQTNKAKIKEQVCRAQFDYEAQGDQELSFKAGDVIKILYKEDDTWWCGEFNGKKGMFPKDFVDLMNHWPCSVQWNCAIHASVKTTRCILDKYAVGETSIKLTPTGPKYRFLLLKIWKETFEKKWAIRPRNTGLTVYNLGKQMHNQCLTQFFMSEIV